MNIDNRISFCAGFKPIVTLNKARWNEICPDFAQATKDYSKETGLYLLQTKTPSGKQQYVFSIKFRDYGILAEDSVCVPNEVIGKWLAELNNHDIAKKLEKIFRILNIRKQTIYDLRKLSSDQPLEQETIAERYLKRMRKFANSDPDIIVPKENVYMGAKGVWTSQMDAKREIYVLKDSNEGRKIIATA